MCYTYTDYIFLTVVSYVSIIGFFVAFPVAFLYLGYRHLSSKQTVVEVPDEFMYSFARNLYTSDASDVRALRPPHVNRDINIAKQAQQQTHAKANKDKMRQRIKDIKHTEDEMPSREPPY